MQLRALAIVAALTLSACPTPPPACGPSTCSGCCDAAGQCQTGTSVTTCGLSGRSCQVCSLLDRCSLGECVPALVPTGGGTTVGGGAAGGSMTAGGTAGGEVGGGTTTGGGAAGGDVGGGAAGGVLGGGSAGGGSAGGSTSGGGSAGGAPLGGGAACATVPTSAAFGVVTLGTGRMLSVAFQNPGATAIQLSFAPEVDFSVVGATTIVIDPGQTVQVPLGFTPSRAGAVTANLFTTQAGCPTATTRLTGQGVLNALTWEPSPVDFGFTQPSTSVQRTLRFFNGTPSPITLSAIATREGTTPSPNFSRVTTSPSLVVPAYGTLEEPLVFRPVVLGPRQGTLIASTPLPTLPTITVPLRGFGGGPVIGAPASLTFGRVAYFNVMPPVSQSRVLTISNVGAPVLPPQPGSGLTLGMPAWELLAGAGTQPGEFSVSLPMPLPTNGLQGGQSADLLVTLTPQSAGMKSATLRLFSNDAVTPTKVVSLSANVVSLPTCAGLTVAEVPGQGASLDFGQVDPGSMKRRGVTFTNTGTQLCLLTDVRPASGPFRLSGGPLSELELMPGERRVVFVEFRPTSTAAVTSTLQASVNDPVTPTLSVPLSGSGADGCLFVAPGEVDFASNIVGCGSPPRSLAIGNACAGQVTGLQARVVGNGFSLTAAPPTTVSSVSAPVTAQVSWRATGLGSQVGALVLTGSVSSRPVTRVVLLTGESQASGPTRDTIPFPATPKADVLLVIDDSCSMTEEQQAISQNASTFLQTATAMAVDFQLGILTTDFDFPPQSGGLVGTPAILTAQTPNLTQAFAQRVLVGTTGSGIEATFGPAVAALTPPTLLMQNAGLFREDASLGVIGVSDADDQSPGPVSFWATRFASVKDVNRLFFGALTPMQANTATCIYDTAPGTRTMALATALGGLTFEICTSDFATPLTSLGTRAFGLRTRWTLRAPASGPVSVFLNGVPVPQTQGPDTVWSFDLATNQLVFTPIYVPQAGTTLEVSYPVACIP